MYPIISALLNPIRIPDDFFGAPGNAINTLDKPALSYARLFYVESPNSRMLTEKLQRILYGQNINDFDHACCEAESNTPICQARTTFEDLCHHDYAHAAEEHGHSHDSEHSHDNGHSHDSEHSHTGGASEHSH